MNPARLLLTFAAAVGLFAIGFGSARAIGSGGDRPAPAVTLVTAPAADGVTVRAPSLRGIPAALAVPPATTSSSATSTGSAVSGSTPPAGGDGSGGGTTTFSPGEQ